MELVAPEFARFNSAKMKYLDADQSFLADIEQDCEAGYGPALYLMGVYCLSKINDRSKALQYFSKGAENGHLPSELEFWRHCKLGFWRRLVTFVAIHRTIIRVVVLRTKNRNDVHVLV